MNESSGKGRADNPTGEFALLRPDQVVLGFGAGLGSPDYEASCGEKTLMSFIHQM